MSDYSKRLPDENGSYQTEEDLQHEAEVKAIFEKRGHEVRKFGRYDAFDFLAIRDEKISLMIEVKSPSTLSTKYPEVPMSFKKFRKITAVAKYLEVPCIFVAYFPDKMLWMDITLLENPREQIINRPNMTVKRNTDKDICVMIPIKNMREFPSTST